MSWELVLPTGTRTLHVEAQQRGGNSYPVQVEWDDTLSTVHVYSENNPLPRPLVLVGKLYPTQANPLLDYSDFLQDLQTATAIRYYYDGTNYWERTVKGPLRVEVLRMLPGLLRYRVELAVVGDWLENGSATANRDWL